MVIETNNRGISPGERKKNVLDSYDIPPVHVDENGRVIIPVLHEDTSQDLATPQQYSGMLLIQQYGLHTDVSQQLWNAAALHFAYGHNTRPSSSQIYKEHTGWSGTAKIQRAIREGIGAVYDALPEEVKREGVFQREEMTALRDRNAPIYLKKLREATGTQTFRDRQAELRRQESPDCVRRTKTSEVWRNLRGQLQFIAAMQEALELPEVKTATAVSLSEAMRKSPQRIAALVAFNQRPETRDLRREMVDVEKLQRGRAAMRAKDLPLSQAAYEREVKQLGMLESIDKSLWAVVSDKPDLLKAIFRRGEFTWGEEQQIREFFTRKGQRPAPHILDRFSIAVANCWESSS